MSLVSKQVQVESHIDDLMNQLVTVVEAIKAGQGITQVMMTELLKLQSLVADVQAIPAEAQESLSGTINAVCVNASALAAALLGKK